MPENPFNLESLLSNGIPKDFLPVTPTDGAPNFGGDVAIGLYITGAGDVAFVSATGQTRTVTVPANFYLTCGVRQVLSTGTTATGIHALVG